MDLEIGFFPNLSHNLRKKPYHLNIPHGATAMTSPLLFAPSTHHLTLSQPYKGFIPFVGCPSRSRFHPHLQFSVKRTTCPEQPSVSRTTIRQQQLETRSSFNMQHAIRVTQFLTLGYTTFGARGFRENSQSFNPKSLDVDLTGRNIIVTGATSGLGKVTALELAARNANVHLLVRDKQRGEAVRDEVLSSNSSSTIQVHECDISSLSDISKLAQHFKDSRTPVHVLVNNAGVMKPNIIPSADGFETAFATNTLGTFALTEMLLPALQIAKPTARVITISSGGMLTEKLNVDDLEGKSITTNDNSIDGPAQYSRCKRRQVALTEYWSRHYADKGIFWASMHPGWADTPGVSFPSLLFFLSITCPLFYFILLNSSLLTSNFLSFVI